MSRTNPYKLKRRSAQKTLLIYGEGLSEEMFIKHLRSIYAYNSNVAVTIRKGKGGTADRIVIYAGNTPGDFERKVVLLDNDKGAKEMAAARAEAKKRGIELIENCPCLEATLLSILNKGASYKDKSSSWCKGQFESNYIEKKKRSEPSEYVKIFPKALLEIHRKKVIILGRIIAILEGGF